jgi:transposase
MIEKRDYTQIQKLEKEVLELLSNGKTQREVAEHFGFKDKYVVKTFVRRHNKQQKELQVGITRGRKGRPAKRQEASEGNKDNEIKRLQMENELLRDFLCAAGRK